VVQEVDAINAPSSSSSKQKREFVKQRMEAFNSIGEDGRLLLQKRAIDLEKAEGRVIRQGGGDRGRPCSLSHASVYS